MAVNLTGRLMRGVVGEVVKPVVSAGGGQLVVQDALNALSMFGAPASLELIEDTPQAASIVDR